MRKKNHKCVLLLFEIKQIHILMNKMLNHFHFLNVFQNKMHFSFFFIHLNADKFLNFKKGVCAHFVYD